MSLAHIVLAFLEQMNGSGTSSNGSSSGNSTEEPTDGTNKKNGEEEPEKPAKSFHRHVLGGYGPYYCSCDKNTPKEYRCPNCKKRGN